MTESKEKALLLAKIAHRDATYRRLSTVLSALLIITMFVALGAIFNVSNEIKQQAITNEKRTVSAEQESVATHEVLKRYIRCIALIPAAERTEDNINACFNDNVLPGGRTVAAPTFNSPPTAATIPKSTTTPKLNTTTNTQTGGTQQGGTSSPPTPASTPVKTALQPVCALLHLGSGLLCQ